MQTFLPYSDFEATAQVSPKPRAVHASHIASP